MERSVDWMRRTAPERADATAAGAAALAAAEPASMRAFLHAFKAEHGGVDAYVASLGPDGIGERRRTLLLE
jgi:hypothetical protein